MYIMAVSVRGWIILQPAGVVAGHCRATAGCYRNLYYFQPLARLDLPKCSPGPARRRRGCHWDEPELELTLSAAPVSTLGVGGSGRQSGFWAEAVSLYRGIAREAGGKPRLLSISTAGNLPAASRRIDMSRLTRRPQMTGEGQPRQKPRTDGTFALVARAIGNLRPQGKGRSVAGWKRQRKACRLRYNEEFWGRSPAPSPFIRCRLAGSPSR
jgi:hypothetical protein